MPSNKKKRVAARRAKTGESYAKALSELRAKRARKELDATSAPAIPSEPSVPPTSPGEQLEPYNEADVDTATMENLAALSAVANPSWLRQVRQISEPIERMRRALGVHRQPALEPLRAALDVQRPPTGVGGLEKALGLNQTSIVGQLVDRLRPQDNALVGALDAVRAQRASAQLLGLDALREAVRPYQLSAQLLGLNTVREAMRPYEALKKLVEFDAAKVHGLDALKAYGVSKPKRRRK
jgi:hypothetical protein